MIVCKCIQKVRDNKGRIIRYTLVDANNITRVVSSNQLKTAIKSRQVEVTNLTLTSNNRLIDNNVRKSNNLSTPQSSKLDALFDLSSSSLKVSNSNNNICDTKIRLYLEYFGGKDTYLNMCILTAENKTPNLERMIKSSVGPSASFGNQAECIDSSLTEKYNLICSISDIKYTTVAEILKQLKTKFNNIVIYSNSIDTAYEYCIGCDCFDGGKRIPVEIYNMNYSNCIQYIEQNTGIKVKFYT